MLKWTLRTPGDNLSCPPSPPNMNNICTNGVCPTDGRVDLEDSNKCWYETRVKVAQVKSTSKVVQFNCKENVHFIENDGREQISENFSIFKRWVSSPNASEEFERKRKRHHKHIKCNALDPLRIFTGDITDSDTGSVYMKLDKTPAALVPKEMFVSSTGPFDPRRRPLVDISNGDYSDLRKHLQQIPSAATSHQHPEQSYFYEQLKPYKDLIIPNRDSKYKIPSISIPFRPDPLGASSTNLFPGEEIDGGANEYLFARTRSSSPLKSQYISAATTATTSITTTTSSSTTTTTSVYNSSSPQMAKYLRYGEDERELMRRRKNAKNSIWRKRHSIADIPSAYRRDNLFQSSLEIQELDLKCRRARVRHIRDSSMDSTLRGDSTGVLEGNSSSQLEGNINRVKGRKETRNCRKSEKIEPIYEKIKPPKQSQIIDATTSTNTISCEHETYEVPGNDLYLYNHFQTAYMTMQDLKDPVVKDYDDVLTSSRDDDYEICVYSSSKSIDKSKRAPIHFPEHHIYENALNLSLSDSTILDNDDKTCDFTSVPQRNVHKPVAIKGSNDLITRFGKSPNDRQNSMPPFGLHLSTEPSKKPCKKDAEHNNKISASEPLNVSTDGRFHRHYENLDFITTNPHYSSSLIARYNSDPNIYKSKQFHTSTGQHVHVKSSETIDVAPTLPLHNLRPPPPPPPFNQIYQPKIRKKSKSCIKLDANLPVIYELQKQEEEMDCRRERKYSTDLQSSYDSEETSKSSDILNYLSSSPPTNLNQNADNLDSGMSEGIHTPLISPMSGPSSPNSPRSDSLLGEAHTPLSIEDLQIYKENGCFEEENGNMESISMANLYKLNNAVNALEQSDVSFCSNGGYNKELIISSRNLNDVYISLDKLTTPISQSTPIRAKLKDTLNHYLEGKIKNTEMSQLLHDAVEKNLFVPETFSDYPFLNNSYKSVYNSSLTRRHSFASVNDISPKLSQTDLHNDTSVWDVRNSSKKNGLCSLRKSHSFLSYSPATRKCQVPFTDNVVKESELVVNGGGSPILEHVNLQGRGEAHWSQHDGHENIREDYFTKRPGSRDGNSNVGEGNKSSSISSPHHGRRRRRSERDSDVKRIEGNRGREITVTPGSFPERKDVREKLGLNHSPDRAFPSCLTSALTQLPSFEGNSTLPGEMIEEIRGGHLVPPSLTFSKHSVESLQAPNVEHRAPDTLTEKQRRRHEESLFRLQCLLKDPQESDHEEDNISADWSLEAVLDEASCSRDFDLSPRSSLGSAGSRTSSSSPEFQDTFSVCTLDSELADSVQFGSKLCDKIREVSEENMFAKLRRSFRKKEKYAPKVGIFMFVDNPMYVSPEVKKEAKIITFTPGKFRKSFRKKNIDKLDNELKENNKQAWYVGNPMYNSPDTATVKTKYSSVSNYASDCQKENINNYKVPKSVIGVNNNRVPLSDIWIQTNPCYESPDLKALNKCDSKLLNNKSPMKRKPYSPKNIKNKPLPSPPKQPLSLLNNESHYLTPILSNRLVGRPPAPKHSDDGSRVAHDANQFIDHEYCTIPGEESDSWTSHSSHSKNSESSSSSAKRTLKFGKSHKKYSMKSHQFVDKDPTVPQGKYFASKSPCATPSRIWRETTKTQQSTPRKYQGILEKNVESIPFGDRGYKTPRAVKRERMIKCQSKKSLPPDLPNVPAPPVPSYSMLEDTNAFHHRYSSEKDLEAAETSSVFQLPPDSIYESLSFLNTTPSTGIQTNQQNDNQRISGIDYSENQRDIFSRSRFNKTDQRIYSNQRALPEPPVEFRTSRTISRTTSGVCSNCSSTSSLCSCSPPKTKSQLTSGVSSSSGISSSYSKKPTSCKKKSRSREERSNNSSRVGVKTPTGNNLGFKVKRTPKRSLPKKYKARDVLQGKGQLRLEVYENFGLLTINIIEARRLRSNFSTLCNPYAKISLVPDNLERTFCRTPLLRATNTPVFNQKFSFDFLHEDLDKRLLISLWNRDTTRKRSEFLGCMTFSVAHITTKRVSGWFRLLTEAVGRRKHFAVSFLNGSLDNSRKLGDIVMEDGKTLTTPKVPELDNCQPPSVRVVPEYQNCPNIYQNTNNNPVPVSQNSQGSFGQTPYTISVNIQRNKDGFGFSVAWTRPPRVERVEPGKAADLAGLKPGDYIIFVGHQNVVKLDENSVLNVIRECGDRLPLEVYRRGVSRTPKTLTNGWARPPSIAPPDGNNIGHIGCDVIKKSKVGHVTFSHESSPNILEEKFIHLLTSEQRFCINCRFCVERYLIPFRFRVDIMTPSAHSKLFTSIEQILDITETIVDRILDTEEENCFVNLGLTYNSVIDHLVEGYNKYFKGISEADIILSKFLKDFEFVELLHNPPVPKRSPDITTFIHLPCAHFREVIALLEDIVAVSTGRHDFYILRETYEKLWRVYKDATSDATKEIRKNNFSPSPIPPMSPKNINYSPARKPLISVLDIENRLVFTKQMTPFRLSNSGRKWLFGSELTKLEGRNGKQYWVMLFTDLLLLTSVNRDRVIYVMDDPIPLEAIIDADFHIKKKVMEFRLSVDLSFDVSSILESGDSKSYLSGTNSGSNSRSSTLSSRGHPKRSKARGRRYVTFRAPSVALKTTWESLIYRQIYACHRSSEQKSQLARVYGLLSPSLFRAGSQDGTVTQKYFHVSQNRSESCDDLRPSGNIFGSTGREIISELDDDQSHSSIKNSRIDDLEPRRQQPLTVDHPSSGPLLVPLVTIDNFDEKSKRSEVENCRIKEEIAGNNQEQTEERSFNKEDANNGEEKHDLINEDLETGLEVRKPKKSFGEKYKHKLFSYRNQPPRRTENRTTKVEKYVNSLRTADISNERSVTPLFDHEENLNKDDFLKKRTEMLRNKPPCFSEGEEMIIAAEYDPYTKSASVGSKGEKISQKDSFRPQELQNVDLGSSPKKEEITSNLKLKCPMKDCSKYGNKNKDLLITPEDYEEYLDGRIEKDYPELKETHTDRGCSKTLSSETSEITKSKNIGTDSNSISRGIDIMSIFHNKETVTSKSNLNKCASNKVDNLKCKFSTCELKVDIESSVLLHHPAGPLSGSSSMSFMDETTPISTNGSCDYYQRITKSVNKPKNIFHNGNANVVTVDMPKASFDSSSTESLNDCVNHNGANLVCKASLPKIFPAYRQDSSASLGNDVNLCSNESSNSSMSISSTSVGSNQIPIKPRSILFIPAKNAKSLPEISLQPPTPQAPKPRENYDAENKIAYDLKVPGYSSMFLTVPGFDYYDDDRYLPGTKYDARTDSENSDDDIVHKPRVFASLIGVAKKRGLKSYGSSCDLSKFGLSSPSDTEENSNAAKGKDYDDRINGNLSSSETLDSDTERSKLSKLSVEEKQKYLDSELSERKSDKIKTTSGENSERISDHDRVHLLKVVESFVEVSISPKNNIKNESPRTGILSNVHGSVERLRNGKEAKHLKRQSKMGSNTSLRKYDNEVTISFDSSCLDEQQLCNTSRRDSAGKTEGHRKGHFGRRSYSNEESSHNRAKQCHQPIPPIIRRMQSADSQGSPSRVRFSPVTDVYFRSSPESSDREDTEEANEEKMNDLQQEASYDEEENSCIDKDTETSLRESDSLSSLSKEKVIAQPKIQKENSVLKSPRKRFTLFRSQKKELSDAERSSSSTTAKSSKGK